MTFVLIDLDVYICLHLRHQHRQYITTASFAASLTHRTSTKQPYQHFNGRGAGPSGGQRCLAGYLEFTHHRHRQIVIPRRDTVVRLGRRAQDRLRLPRFARIFSETHPGILEQHLRDSCLWALFSCICLSFGLLFVVLERPLHPVAWVLALGVPVSALMGIWAWLSRAKRRIDRGTARDTESGSLIVGDTNTEGRRGIDDKTASAAVDSGKTNLLPAAAAANKGPLAVPTPGPSSVISAAASEDLRSIWSDTFIPRGGGGGGAGLHPSPKRCSARTAADEDRERDLRVTGRGYHGLREVQNTASRADCFLYLSPYPFGWLCLFRYLDRYLDKYGERTLKVTGAAG